MADTTAKADPVRALEILAHAAGMGTAQMVEHVETIRAALAQQAGAAEPFAYMSEADLKGVEISRTKPDGAVFTVLTAKNGHFNTPLYRAPQPAIPEGTPLPPIVREVLEWYAGDPSIWVEWNKEGWAEEERAKASGHYTFIGEDKRGHNEYVPNSVRAEEALAALDEWIAQHNREGE